MQYVYKWNIILLIGGCFFFFSNIGSEYFVGFVGIGVVVGIVMIFYEWVVIIVKLQILSDRLYQIKSDRCIQFLNILVN